MREWKSLKTYQEILFDYFEGIARITINRPRYRNAFTPLTVAEISDALRYCREAQEICVVVLTGAELFTGNTLLVISLLDRRVTWCTMLRNWGVVYLGNFLGALTLSWICARFGWLDAGDGALGTYTMQLAVGKMTMPFGKAFFMGVLCNILVTVAVLASLSAKDAAGRILGAWAPVMFFVVAGFSHSIADMTYCALALFGKSAPACAAVAQAAGADLSVLTWGRYFLGNMLPVTLGNTAGGGLVGLAAWYCYLRKKG